MDGRGQFATVARLTGDIAAWMPTMSLDVRISKEYVAKMFGKHGLKYEDLGIVQRAIDEGWCTKSRENALDFIYVDTRGQPRRFILGLKSAAHGRETWFQTLYMADEMEVRRRLRRAMERGKFIRGHQWS